MKKFALLAFILFAITTIAAIPPQATQDLRWRLLGPLRAGWSSCAEGIPDDVETFYFGAVDGGVWKTEDAGLTWQPIADQAPFSSVGALAIAPGKPRTVYVGTGHVDTRYDVMNGTGIFKSDDDGKTWISLGLSDSQHIGRIWIDPRNANVLLVAALGHLFGANPERGVFRTEDGGRNWKRVLFVDENTGAVDLAVDPEVPDVIYAALWQVRQYPWQSYFMQQVGPGSGIWKSTNGGKTWSKTSQKGLPDEPLSRIGLAVASHTNGQRLYASINAEKKGGFFRTDDGGASWQLVNPDKALASTYFGRVTADPRATDTVYVMGQSVRQSLDGGKTFTIIKGAPGGDDYHFFWINPRHPAYRILASDQGTAVSVNGGASWSPWYNQATGQFYHLAADNRFPYWVYSGQQDSGTVRVASRSDYGQLTFRDWHPVGGDERDYDIPDPADPNIVYGSGLGGRLSKWDARNGRVTNISPWPVSTYGARPTTVKYRYTWITPIAIDTGPAHEIYQGSQVLFMSSDKGRSWKIISPDLSGIDPNAKDCAGNVPIERATACGYGVIFSIAPSAANDSMIWIGTDNGRIHLTRDNGKTWKNVTPDSIKDWSKIVSIDASPKDPSTAYIAVDRHRMDDMHPYIYRTHDYGKTWTAITSGIRDGSWANVVRLDPTRKGLLYAGARTGVFVSLDDGEHWDPLQLNLPRSGVNDLLVHEKDLIAATQGRSLWVLDDLTPIRYIDPSKLQGPVLIPPARVYRMSTNENRDTPLPPEMPTTPNPPNGAVIDYFISQTPSGAISVDIVDSGSHVVRTFRSDQKPERPDATRYFAEKWLQPLPSPSTRIGHNRFVWDLRLQRPAVEEYQFSIAAVPGVDTVAVPQGFLLLPGHYTVRLNVEGKTLTQPLEISQDPRSRATPSDLNAHFMLYSEVAAALAHPVQKLIAAKEMNKKFDTDTTSGQKTGKELEDAKNKRAEFAKLLDTNDPHSLASLVGALTSLLTDLEDSDGPPTAPQRQLYEESKKELDALTK